MCDKHSLQPTPPKTAEELLRGEQKLVCEHCGKPMVKHIFKEGARFHVTSWYKGEHGGLSHCSEKNCEHNHGEGYCVPYSEETKKRMREKEREKSEDYMHLIKESM